MNRTSQYKPVFWLVSALLTLVLMVLGVTSALAAQSGECGEGLAWTLEGGTLTITGSGEMTDFTEPDMAPWYPYRADILRLSLPDGLTSIGDIAFYDCEKLTHVVLPDSVERVGDYAFLDCAGITLLDLGSGLRTVGEAAFSDCYALRSLDLPDGLESIGMKGFYRCESITSVTIPASVASLGVSAFGYCKSLVSADIRASITEIPEFLFYGCEKLSSVKLPEQITQVNDFSFRGCDQLGSVYFDGGAKTLEELKEITNNAQVSNNTPVPSATGGTATLNGDGTITQQNITVVQGENASVASKVEHTFPETTVSEGTYKTEVQVTVNGETGWQEAREMVTDALRDLNDRLTQDGEAPRVDVNVDVKGTDVIDQSFVAAVAGQNVQTTIHTCGGSAWKMDMAALDAENTPESYDLSYILAPGSQALSDELGTTSSFVLTFNTSTEVEAEVLIRLGDAWARQNATLFQRERSGLTRRQTVVVDGRGYAHFYLASVNAETEYYVGMNAPVVVNDKGEVQDDAILPEELLAEYDAVRYEPVQYEITGRTSSWGMNINQVTWIMVGVLAVCVTGVGVTMFLLNKRKLKMGYVPDLDDEEM